MLKRINPGERITAEWLNQAIDQINDLAFRHQGGDVTSMLALALTSSIPDLFEAVRIVKVYRGVDVIQSMLPNQPIRPILTPEWPTQVTYDVTSILRGWTAERVRPTYGRPVRGDEAKIYPASAGMLAVYVRGPKFRTEPNERAGQVESQLMLLPGSELVYRRRCTPPAAIANNLNIPLPEDLRERLMGSRLISSSGKDSVLQSPTPPGPGSGLPGTGIDTGE